MSGGSTQTLPEQAMRPPTEAEGTNDDTGSACDETSAVDAELPAGESPMGMKSDNGSVGDCSDSALSNAKRKRNNKRKEDQFISHALKGVSQLQDPEEKLKALARKMYEMSEESKQVQTTSKAHEKRIQLLQRENEQSSADLSKAILARTRLEALCRELQRQNKALKDEMVLRAREDDEKRQDLSRGFQSKLTEISALIEDNNARNSQLKEQNFEIREKLNEVVDRYAKREEEVKALLKTAEQQTALAEAKIAKAEQEMLLCRQLYLKEKETWTRLEAEYKTQLNLLEQNEGRLKSEVKIYSDKYQGFQDAFKNFQTEMNNMTKKITHLEKETLAWRQRYEKTASALIVVSRDKEDIEGKLETAKKMAARMETVSRALNEDRADMRKLLQSTNDGLNVGPDEWQAFLDGSMKRLKECERSLSEQVAVSSASAAPPRGGGGGGAAPSSSSSISSSQQPANEIPPKSSSSRSSRRASSKNGVESSPALSSPASSAAASAATAAPAAVSGKSSSPAPLACSEEKEEEGSECSKIAGGGEGSPPSGKGVESVNVNGCSGAGGADEKPLDVAASPSSSPSHAAAAGDAAFSSSSQLQNQVPDSSCRPACS